MPPGRKNKRGARGSVEEEISAAERSNMANSVAGASNEDNLSQASNQAEQEPSLHDIQILCHQLHLTTNN